MAQFIISPAAEQDILNILTWTHEQFGENARLRYETLLVQAIRDLAADPKRPGSTIREDISPHAHTYHLWHIRNRVAKSIGRVRHPRHFLVYRIPAPDRMEIGRVLHDSMDLVSHLPAEHQCKP